MTAQLVAFATPVESLRAGAPRGWAYPVRAKVRRYFERKPGWVAQEIRDMQRRMTDWEFLAKHGSHIPTWLRP